MANEILYSSLASDARAAELVSANFIRLQAVPGSLPTHPAFVYGGSIRGRASKVITVSHYNHGGDLMSAVAEGTAASNTALTTGSTDVTVARYVLQRDVGDLAKMTDEQGAIAPMALAEDASVAFSRTLLSLVANVTDGFTATQTATNTMTLADHLAAVNKLAALGAPVPYLAVYHPKQWGEIIVDIGTASGGSVAYDPATPEIIKIKGEGYQGSLNGVDIFTTTLVPSSGGDRKGAILSAGAVCWADGEVAIEDAANQINIGSKVLFERDRDASAGTTKYVYTAYVGVAFGVDNRGVTVNSDAA